MTSRDKSKEFNPLAVNILRLQRYNFNLFTLEEVVLFEYLVVKAQAFQFKPFFHSTKTMCDETGIKKSKMAGIIEKFQQRGIITVEVKGFPKIQWFTVNFDVIHKKLNKIYQLSENGELLSDFGKLLSDFYKLLSENSQQKELIEGTKNKELKKKNNESDVDRDGFAKKSFFSLKEIETAKKFILTLDELFNHRRELKNTKKESYGKTALPKSKKIIKLLCECLEFKTELEIRNSFLAYADAVIAKKIEPAHILNYFFHQKEEGEFDVVDNFLEHFNSSYSIKG